eukprot:2161747-Amphidinium_carterae.1
MCGEDVPRPHREKKGGFGQQSSSPEKIGSRNRDILPLPGALFVADKPTQKLSRCVHRRLERRCHVGGRAMLCAKALNSMSNYSTPLGNATGNSVGQVKCANWIWASCSEMGAPPEGLDGPGALSALRASPSYTGEACHLVGLDVERLALPESGFTPVSLERASPIGRNIVATLEAKVIPECVAEERLKEIGLKRGYLDPALRQPTVYGRFVRRCVAAGLMELVAAGVPRVGAFAVRKKNGDQRLVIDARVSNEYFSKPEHVNLCTGQGFSRLRVDGGPPVVVSGVDISVAFYAILMPESLRHLFCLPALRADAAGVAQVEGRHVAGHTKVYPRIRCLPMGWSHALWACQLMHESIVRVGNVGPHNLLIDGRVAPKMDPFVHTQYVDNFICLSQNSEVGRKVAEVADERLREKGLPTHGVEHSVGGTTLGWTFDAQRPRVFVSRTAAWRLILALEELCKRGRASGRELSVVI